MVIIGHLLYARHGARVFDSLLHFILTPAFQGMERLRV